MQNDLARAIKALEQKKKGLRGHEGCPPFPPLEGWKSLREGLEDLGGILSVSSSAAFTAGTGVDV